MRKPFRFAAVYGTALTLFFVFVLLDAFVFPRPQAAVAPVAALAPVIPSPPAASDIAAASPSPEVSAEPVITGDSYQDENIQITVETIRKYDTTLYVADIRLSDPSLLRTALAEDTFGRNITDTTSDMAELHNAVFAVNGDYYGFREAGWVLRNGVLYRDTPYDGADALVIGKDGDLSVIGDDADITEYDDAWQIFSFGPALVEDGEIAVNENSEISGRSSGSNPRTAIGQAGELHYIVIVSDGRAAGETGLSLYQLAGEFAERGCSVAYNLDGGGSSTMVLNGVVINDPVGGGGWGRRGGNSSERKVSDIVYVGYE
ncbi:MAG: phosphodiester glycosidase family protein [Oscillospiraceae bacterium]|nr:phosphodiester glycosidase family protein [Oscillospiraceae bacterium]